MRVLPASLAEHDLNLPAWLTPAAAINDPLTPADWRRHLTERRDLIDHHLTAHGALLATDPPSWTAPLGPVPAPDTNPDLRTTWERTVALTYVWRALDNVPDRSPGLGDRPDTPHHAAAYDALNQHIHTLHRHATLHRQPPVQTRQEPAEPAQPCQYRTGPGPAAPRLSSPVPRDDAAAPRTPISPVAVPLPVVRQAERLAAIALAAALTGQTPPEEWIEYIPSPDEDDTDQQHHYVQLVTAIAAWRQRHNITGTEPLGASPGDHTTEEWQHLTGDLDRYQRARIDDRLRLLRIRREAARERLEDAAQEAAATDRASRRAARPRSDNNSGANRPERSPRSIRGPRL